MHANISSKFVTGIIEKALEKLIKKKLGMDVKLTIEQINIAYEEVNGEEKAGVWVSVAGETSKDNLKKLLKKIGL